MAMLWCSSPCRLQVLSSPETMRVAVLSSSTVSMVGNDLIVFYILLFVSFV
jgi:hypothetical protein